MIPTDHDVFSEDCHPLISIRPANIKIIKFKEEGIKVIKIRLHR
jgi:hypothetical protein